jgi:hypothetical protein
MAAEALKETDRSRSLWPIAETVPVASIETDRSKTEKNSAAASTLPAPAHAVARSNSVKKVAEVSIEPAVLRLATRRRSRCPTTPIEPVASKAVTRSKIVKNSPLAEMSA